MKKLYDRNKDVETYHKQKISRPMSALPNNAQENENDDLEILTQFKQRED
jgi:hypothetical protein